MSHDHPPRGENDWGVDRLVQELRVHQIELEAQNHDLAKARAELEVLLERYAELYDEAPAGYLSVDRLASIEQINRGGAALLGQRQADLVGQSLTDYLVPLDRSKLTEILDLASSEAKTQRAEVSTLPLAGKPSLRLRLEARWANRHDLCRLIAVDITEQHGTAARLERSERLAQATLDALPASIAVVDEDGTIIAVNRSWTQFAEENGAQAGAVGEGVNYLEVCSRADGADRESGEQFAAALRAALAGGPSEFLAEYACHSPHEQRWFLPQITPVTGLPARQAVIVHHNVTERKALQERLLQVQKMDTLGRLAGGIAHDFNNLLTVINLGVEGVIHHHGDNLLLLDELRDVVDAGARGSRLTRQLLAVSRKQVTRTRSLDLNATLESLRNLLRGLVGPDIGLVIEVTAGLGMIEADPGQIEQVVMNLVVNARDAMPNGGTLRIETHRADLTAAFCAGRPSLKPGAYVWLVVSDTGVGMDRDTLARAFEPLFTTKQVGEGTGLGLATVYGIVQQSHGHIELRSDLGSGTTANIYLPIKVTALAPSVSPDPTRVASTGRETVLVAEDEGGIRMLVERILARAGYAVLVAQDGVEALEKLASSPLPVDLLVTDLIMPRMGGVELGIQVVARYPSTKVLYISGYTGHGELPKQLGKSPNFLAKPFTASELIECVRQILDHPHPSDADSAQRVPPS